MTVIGLIRHGVTDWNLERRIQGQIDIPLNHTGRMQAQALSEYMEGQKWDVLYSSDLSRAKETANYLADVLELPVHTDARLREKAFGQAEGMTIQERIEKWGDHWKSHDIGAEDDGEMISRGKSFIEEVAVKHKGKKILAVSHGALLGNLLRTVVPELNTDEHIYNTSLTIIEKTDEGVWKCKLYNYAEHLQALGDLQ